MGIFHFLIDIYFAAVLGVAGLAKLDDPHFFTSILHHQGILPKWSIGIIGKIFPWLEIVLPVLLLITTNIYKIAITIFTLILLIFFFIFNTVVYSKKRAESGCGCFGKYVRQRDFGTVVTTSFIQLILGMLLVVLSLWTYPFSRGYYLISSVLYIAVFSWLAWRTWQRHRRFAMAEKSAPIITSSSEKAIG